MRHIVSNVTARLRPGADPLDALAAVFPGGTITGVPKIRCMEILDRVEPVPRGFYTGALFYLTPSGPPRRQHPHPLRGGGRRAGDVPHRRGDRGRLGSRPGVRGDPAQGRGHEARAGGRPGRPAARTRAYTARACRAPSAACWRRPWSGPRPPCSSGGAAWAARRAAGSPSASSAVGLIMLMLALNTEGQREAPTTAEFLLSGRYVTGHVSASASLPYYVITAVCLLLGTAGLVVPGPAGAPARRPLVRGRGRPQLRDDRAALRAREGGGARRAGPTRSASPGSARWWARTS